VNDHDDDDVIVLSEPKNTHPGQYLSDELLLNNTVVNSLLSNSDAKGNPRSKDTDADDSSCCTIDVAPVPIATRASVDTSPLSGLVYLDGDGDNAVITDGMAEALHSFCQSTNDNSNNQQLLEQDKWSCGYRNTQMLLSALIPLLPADHSYFRMGRTMPQHGNVAIPSLMQLQQTLEAAWSSGLDAKGALHYSNQIVNKPIWIGAVEVWTMFAYWQIDACVVQFISCAKSRKLLGSFCAAHFSKSALEGTCLQCGKCPTRVYAEQTLEMVEASPPKVNSSHVNCSCSVLPLYLQWSGHSILVVGVETDKTGKETHLLTLDPVSSGLEVKYSWIGQQRITKTDAVTNRTQCRRLGRRPLAALQERDCQVILVAPSSAQHLSCNAATAACAAVQKAQAAKCTS